MLVRVYDKQTDTYFKSEVYAVINPGFYEKRLVIVPDKNGDYFRFFDYLDKSNPKLPKALINIVLSNGFNSSYELLSRSSGDVDKKLEGFAQLLDKKTRFFDYMGYAWIYEDIAFLSSLLKGEMVSTKGYESQIINPDAYKKTGWHYIESQRDINFFMKQTSSFHDTVLKDMIYVSGAYVDDKNAMHCTDSKRQITMCFDSQWCRPIEMVFEGVAALNLRPYPDNYSSNIYGASLFLRKAAVFFCDGQVDDVDKSYEGTWIESYNLRWRFCD